MNLRPLLLLRAGRVPCASHRPLLAGSSRNVHLVVVVIVVGLVGVLGVAVGASGDDSRQVPSYTRGQVRVWVIRYRTHTGLVRQAFLDLPRWYGPRRDPPLPLVISPHGRQAIAQANSTRWGNLPAKGVFAVVNPQGQGRVLGNESWGDPGQIADLARMPRLLEQSLPWLRLDRSRVYAVGGSMGGQEVLLLLARFPHLLRGVVAFDAPTDLALRYHDMQWLHKGAYLRGLMRREVGATPADAPRLYAARSPLEFASRIAHSDVRLALWWSRRDRVVVDGSAQSGRLYQLIKRFDADAPVREIVGSWPHMAEMNWRTGLPGTLRWLHLLPALERRSRGDVETASVSILASRRSSVAYNPPSIVSAGTSRNGRGAQASAAASSHGILSRLATVRRSFGTSYDASGTFLFGGRATFPIALSNPPPLDGATPSGINGLDEVVRAGVNLFRVGPNWSPWSLSEIARAKQWNEAAARRGVHTWINLNTVSRSSPRWRVAERLRNTVLALLTGPSSAGIGLWKGADEPWLRHIHPTSLEFAYCRVTSRGRHGWCAGQRPLDRHHLWVTIESAKGSAASLAAYSAVTDTHGVDVYPIAIDEDATGARDRPLNLHLVGIWTRRLASITPDHSVWTTLQICFSSSYARRTGRYLIPTASQERYMVYDAIINGARGLAFFGGDNPHCWSPRDRAHRWNWTFWNATLKHLVTEIGAQSPLSPALVNPGSSRHLSTTDPSTEAISRTDATNTGAKELWIIAARHGAGTKTVTITGLPSMIKHGIVYPQDRSIIVEHGSLTDHFRQWEVHIYRFTGNLLDNSRALHGRRPTEK